MIQNAIEIFIIPRKNILNQQFQLLLASKKMLLKIEFYF